jgi:hypothetical protein
MRARPTPIRAGSKARAVYDRAHVAWRAGAIGSWYYGRRSPTDPAIVWLVDGVEYDGKDLAGVAASLDAAQARAGIAHAAFGKAWCGYRSLHIVFAHDSRLTERYDAVIGRVVREYEHAGSIAATSEAA